MGRFPVGMDAMGASAKNRLAGITFAAGDRAKVGSYGGVAPIKTLTVAEMPSHGHGVTDPKHSHTGSGTTGTESVDHVHTGTTAGESVGHTHRIYGTTWAEGDHRHGMAYAPSKLVGAGTLDRVGGAQDHTDITTMPAGAHSHTMDFTSGANSVSHTHSFGTGGRSAAHTHTYSFTTAVQSTGITVNANGSGTAWQLMAPFIQLCFHIKL
jgi:hypothetical protein